MNIDIKNDQNFKKFYPLCVAYAQLQNKRTNAIAAAERYKPDLNGVYPIIGGLPAETVRGHYEKLTDDADRYENESEAARQAALGAASHYAAFKTMLAQKDAAMSNENDPPQQSQARLQYNRDKYFDIIEDIYAETN